MTKSRSLKLSKQRYETSKLLHRAFNSKPNVIKINRNNTFEHELAKFLMCWEIAQDGKHFVCEAVFENKKRADILVLDDEEAIEILQSETMESIAKKNKDYPVPIVPFKAKYVLSLWIEKIKKVCQ